VLVLALYHLLHLRAFDMVVVGVKIHVAVID